MKRKYIWRLLTGALVVTIFALGAAKAASDKNLLQTAMDREDLSTFVTAIRAAGLENTLKGPGPFTVFAPNNDAFNKLPQGQLQTLMADPARLKSILMYHIVNGKTDAKKLQKTDQLQTAEGGPLRVISKKNKIMVDQADVVKPDITASNGVIHVVNTLLMPSQNMPAPK